MGNGNMDFIEFRCNGCNTKFSVSSRHAGKSTTCKKCGSDLRVPAATPAVEFVTATIVAPEPPTAPPIAQPAAPPRARPTAPPRAQPTAAPPMFNQLPNPNPIGQTNTHWESNSASNLIDGIQEWSFNVGRMPAVQWATLAFGILLCLTVVLFPLGFLIFWFSARQIIYSYTQEYQRISSYQKSKEKMEQNQVSNIVRGAIEFVFVIGFGTAVGVGLFLWFLR